MLNSRYDYSETGTKSDSDGSKRLVGSVREAEADSGFGQREEENKDNQVVAEPRVERDNHFVSGNRPLRFYMSSDSFSSRNIYK